MRHDWTSLLLNHLRECGLCRVDKALRLPSRCQTRKILVRETLYERHGR